MQKLKNKESTKVAAQTVNNVNKNSFLSGNSKDFNSPINLYLIKSITFLISSLQEQQGSNLRPSVLETDALPAELYSFNSRITKVSLLYHKI